MKENIIKLGESYLQYTKNMTPLQRGRVEKSLDKQINIKGLGVLTEKDWYTYEYLKGCNVEIDKDYTTYNKRTGEMTKPKDRYLMRVGDTSFYEITKTGLEFIQYLQKLNAKEKDIVNCLKIEKQLEEKARIQKEHELNLKREQEAKEKLTKKEEFNQNKANYIKIGRPLIEPHIELLRKELIDFMASNNLEGNLDTILEEFVEELSWYIGNPKLMKGRVEYYVTVSDEDFSRRGRNRHLYRNVLVNLLGVTPQDSGQTASAKIRAFIDGRQYKHSKPVETIKVFSITKSGYAPLEGTKVKVHDNCIVLVKNNNEYQLIEPLTGLLLTRAKTKVEVIEKIKKTTFYDKKEFYLKMVLSNITKLGLVPTSFKTSGIAYTRKSFYGGLETLDFADKKHNLDKIGKTCLITIISKDMFVAVDEVTGYVILAETNLTNLVSALEAFSSIESYNNYIDSKKK